MSFEGNKQIDLQAVNWTGWMFWRKWNWKCTRCGDTSHYDNPYCGNCEYPRDPNDPGRGLD